MQLASLHCMLTLIKIPADHAVEKGKKDTKRKDYAFRRQFNVMPNIIPGCPNSCCIHVWQFVAMLHAFRTMSLRSPLHLHTHSM